jgi:chromosome segregation ATPase
MDKTELKEELGALGKQIDSLMTIVGDFYEKLENIEFGPDVDTYVKKFAASEKMPKKQRKELALAHIKKNFPKFCQHMKDMELTLEGLQEIISDKATKLEEVQDSICELENLKEEIEQNMNDI